MSKLIVVFKRDYLEMRRSAAFRTMLIIVAVVTVAASAGVSIGLRLQPWLGDAQAAPLLDLFIGLVLYFLPFFVLLAFIWAFANLPVTREKVNGNIEALMATPVTPRVLWLGKSLSIYFPAYTAALGATAVSFLAINLSAIYPAAGQFAVPVPALVLGVVVSPLLFLGLLLFMILFAMSNNPDIALAPSLIIGFALMMGVPAGLATGLFDLNSWPFVLWYTAGTLVVWLAVLVLTRLLTRQNIVLSSRGG